MFSDKGSKFSNLGLLRLIKAFEKKPFHCNCLFICYKGIRFFSKFYSFERLYLISQERLNSFPEKIFFQLCVFHLNLLNNLFQLFVAVINAYFFVYKITGYFQQQPSRSVLRKKCSENMQQIYKRIPMLKCDFKKSQSNSQIALRHGCSPVNLLCIFRKPFPKNISGGLLPYFNHLF